MRRKPNSLKTSLFILTMLFLVGNIPAYASVGTQLHPNLAGGASNERVMDRTEWDGVNLFNGNLNLSLPLSSNYPLAGNFGYQFTVNYNSGIWDFDESSPNVVSSSPKKCFNAGLGWDISFGRLIDLFATDNGLGRWVYISPDGAAHSFFDKLHADGIEPSDDNVFYTRDGTYYRLKQVDAVTTTIESPDGKIRTFVLTNGVWRLSQIADRFSSYVNFSYATNNVWTLTDNYGRTQAIYFKSDPSGFYPNIVDRVVLSAFGGSTATYTFTYASAAVSRPTFDTDPSTPATVNVPLLTSITFPDGSKHSFTYYPTGAPANSSGRIASRQLPTLGKIQWTYQTYAFTSPGCPTSLATTYRNNTGVATRAIVNSAGATLGGWAYSPVLKPSGTEERELSNTVTTPLGDKTVYYFSVNTQGTGTGWTKSDYALPGTKNQYDDTGTRILARQYFDCDSSGSNCQLLRSTFVRYEQDEQPNPSSPEVDTSTNRREASQRTLYHDDVENGVTRFAAINRSNYDGLGHYRQVDTDGNFGSGDVRQTFTNYDAVAVTYPSASYTPPGTNAPWVVNTFSQIKVVEGQSSKAADYYFDRATGFLRRLRRWKSTNLTGTAGSNDVVIVYTPDSTGQTGKEQYYGGDVQTIETASLDKLSLPADQYQIRYVYKYGVESSAQFYDAAGNAFGPKTIDRDIDKNTGLVATNRDTAGLATQYTYDALVRPTWIKPASNQGAWTEYRYTSATGNSWQTGAKKETYQYTNGGVATLTYNAEVQDSFGNVCWEQIKMPDGSFPIRYKHYNALGWQTDQSEFSNSTATYTQYLNYDPFGRVRTIRPPEGAQHDTTYSYAGIRTETRTPQVGVSYNTSTGQINEEGRPTDTVRDRQGRIWQEIRHYKDSFGSWRVNTTVYAYDVSGWLLESDLDGQRVGALYAYDGRGFLSSVNDDNKTTSYLQIDALGNARRNSRFDQATQFVVDLTNVYDRAGRLTTVRDPNNSSKLWKEFIYADTNGTNDWRAGKLWKTKRYNDMSRFLSQVGVAVVTETYTYGGAGGRVSLYETEMSDQLGRFEKFGQTYMYNDLGQIQQMGYPNSEAGSNVTLGRDRQVVMNYTNGGLTSIAGSLNSQNENWVTSISYNGNGLTKNVVHSNGVTDLIAYDPNVPSHIASVYTAGAKNKTTNAPDDFNSGAFQYDGAGSVVKIGAQYFVAVQGAAPATQPGPETATIDPCQSGYIDPLSMIFAAADYQCNVKVFYYYTASDRVYKVEDGVAGEKTWSFVDLSGRLLTEYSTAHAHYQPWPSTWLYTRDYIYRDGSLLAIAEQGLNAPASVTHYHIGHGVAGILTDKNGFTISD